VTAQHTRLLRIAGMISGGGRTLLNLIDHIDRDELDAEVACIIASRASGRSGEEAL